MSIPYLILARSMVGLGLSLIFNDALLLPLLQFDSYLTLFLLCYFRSFKLKSTLFFPFRSTEHNSNYDLTPLSPLSWLLSLEMLKLILMFSLSKLVSLSLFLPSLSLVRCLLPNLCRFLLIPPSSLLSLRWEQMGFSFSGRREVLLRVSVSRLSFSYGYLKVQLLQCLRTLSNDQLALTGCISLTVRLFIFSYSFSTSLLTKPSNSFSSAYVQERRYALRVCMSAVNQKGSGAQSQSAVSTNLVRFLSNDFIQYYVSQLLANKQNKIVLLQQNISKVIHNFLISTNQCIIAIQIFFYNDELLQELIIFGMDEEVEIQMGDYVFTEKYCIGQGSFGKVYRGKNIKSGRQVAIKEMDGQLISEQQIGREITILKALKHPNIVEYEDAFQNNGYFYIVTEYCRGGDLRSLLDDSNSDEEDAAARQKKILDMFWQVCEGFQYLRKFDIIHRDLKPSNILLQNGLYKIADFGLAKREMVHRSVVHQQLMGVPIYLSPQILSKNHYTYKCDVWSLGIIVFEMLFDHLPWKATDIQTLFFQIMNNPEPYTEHAAQLSPLFSEIFKKTLAYLEKGRSSWDQLLALRDAKLNESKRKDNKKEKKEQFQITHFHKSISKEEGQILKHILGQGRALESELMGITNQECLRGLFITIKKYVEEGSDLRGMLRDCCFIFLKLVANNLHLQLMEYEKLEESRQLLVFIELLHDYVSNAELGNTFTKGSFQNSLRNKGISEYAASVISKVNTLLLVDQAQQA